MTALVLSGAEITDALRALGVQGDGRAVPDSSMGIWPAATNLITNGGFETNTTGWSAVRGAAISRVTSDHKFGVACAQVATDSSQSNQLIQIGVTPAGSTVYTVSFWARSISGTTTLILGFSDGVTEPTTTFTITPSWARYSYTRPATAAVPLVSFIEVGGNGITTMAFLVDGVQLETGPIATPYIETDGGTASRAAARVQVPVAGLFTNEQAWFAVRVRPGWPGGTADSHRLVSWRDAGNGIELQYNGDSTLRAMAGENYGADFANVAYGSGYAAGVEHTVIARFTPTALGISLDGAAFITTARTKHSAPTSSVFYIGELLEGGGQLLAGDVLWFAAGSGTLTDADAAAIHAFGNTDPTAAALPGTPTLVWPADTSAVSYYIGAASIISKGASYTPQISKGASFI